MATRKQDEQPKHKEHQPLSRAQATFTYLARIVEGRAGGTDYAIHSSNSFGRTSAGRHAARRGVCQKRVDSWNAIDRDRSTRTAAAFEPVIAAR